MNILDLSDQLENVLVEACKTLYAQAATTDLLDFPDYANVGDSAIFLGEMALFSKLDVKVESVQSVNSLTWNFGEMSDFVTFQGGGNLGGLYPTFDAYRMMVIDKLPKSSSVVVMPQSVGLNDQEIFSHYRNITAGKRVSFMARDFNTKKILDSHRLNNVLAPDAVHCLGFIESQPSTQKFLVLKRTDAESQAGNFKNNDVVDWLGDDFACNVKTKLRHISRLSTRTSKMFRFTPESAQALAAARLQRGVTLLSKGEIIVTDRLHAMLIGLQMGRQVVAIDNAYKKLSTYADTWGLMKLENLEFRNSFEN